MLELDTTTQEPESLEKDHAEINLLDTFGQRFDEINSRLKTIKNIWNDEATQFEDIDFQEGATIGAIVKSDISEILDALEENLVLIESAIPKREAQSDELESKRDVLRQKMTALKHQMCVIKQDPSLAHKDIESLQSEIEELNPRIDAAAEVRREKGNDPLYKHHRDEPNSQPVLEYNYAVENEQSLIAEREQKEEAIVHLKDNKLSELQREYEELQISMAELDALPSSAIAAALAIDSNLQELNDYFDTFGKMPIQEVVEDTISMSIDDTRVNMAIPSVPTRRKKSSKRPKALVGRSSKRRPKKNNQMPKQTVVELEPPKKSAIGKIVWRTGYLLTTAGILVAAVMNNANKRDARTASAKSSATRPADTKFTLPKPIIRSLDTLPQTGPHGDVRTFMATLEQKGDEGTVVNGERPWTVSIQLPFDRQYEKIKSTISFLATSKAEGHSAQAWHELKTELYALKKAAEADGHKDVVIKVAELETQLDIVDQLEQNIPDPARLAFLLQQRVGQIRPQILSMPNRTSQAKGELFTIGEHTSDILRSHNVLTTNDLDRKLVENAIRSGSMTQITESDDVPVAWGEHGYAFLFTNVEKEGDTVWAFSRSDHGSSFPLRIEGKQKASQ